MMLFSYDVDILPKIRLIGRIKYSEPWVHFPRIIDEYILYIIRGGDMYLAENGTQYHLTQGDFFLLEPNQLHEGYQKAVCDYYYIHFKHSNIKKIPDDIEKKSIKEMMEKRRVSLTSYNLDTKDITDSITIFPKYIALQNFQDYKAILNKAVDIYNKSEEHYKRVSSVELHRFILGVAHDFIIEQNSRTNEMHLKKSQIVCEEILKYLNVNYAKKITSKSLEERFEINFDYVNRIFSKITGYTIFHYLNATRVNHAKELISTTSLKFSKVAYLVGIDDQYYFSKIFKKYTGMTPSDYFECVNKIDKRR